MIFDMGLMLLSGILTGLLSGLFGLGGGVVVVPVLFIFFTHLGVPESSIMHLAIGTSLAAMVTTTFNSIIQHHRKGNIDWHLVRWLFLPVACGALLGSVISEWVNSHSLRYLFMALLVFVILTALFKKGFRSEYTIQDFKFPKNYFSKIYFFIVGFISVLLGVGGSLFTIPYFRRYYSPMKQASALAVALTPAVSVLGALGYLFIGLKNPPVFAHTFGYIYWPAFLGIALGSLLGVPIGAYLSHKLPDQYQIKIYIVLLFVFLLMIVY